MTNLKQQLRAVDEDTIEQAMQDASVSYPINDSAELLEAFNRVLDVLGLPDADGDIEDVGNYEDR